ncbi:MAG: protein kinase domain-containing protein [Planctomycetota bacterium]
MPLAPGSKLSFYEVLAPLGAGAMGEVYRARDSKLGREVAIKVLPEHFATDAERLKRFEREATTLASLNHPNVAQIFGVDQVGDTCFLVLELVPGESLEERLKRGPLPLEEALDVCKQIAEGLEAAHEAGVIHRDLKPANVRLTPDGKVKVLDFGLAKPVSEHNKGSSTDSVLSTEAGRLLGTPTYMAPEQARGKAIDKRVDIWAFGCVLYECLTAKRAFVGETLTDVLGAVLHAQADLDALPSSTPRRVRELLESCFVKDPRRRLRDIGMARLELERAATEPRTAPAAVEARRATRKSPVVLLSAALVAGAIAFAAWTLRPPSDATERARPVVRATLALPKGLKLPMADRSIAVSPDGTRVVASLLKQEGASPPSLYLRDLSRLEFYALSGTEEAMYPFWSPDGRSIAFFAGRELRCIELADGIIRVICKAPAGRGGTWGTQGTIVFAPSAVGGLSIVSESGGEASPITEPAEPDESHRVPQMLPDGRRFLFYVMNKPKPGVYAFDPASKQSRRVVESVTEAVFVEPSALVFARDENLMVQPFDLDRLELTGSPKPIAAGVQWDSRRVALNMGLSSRGALVYQPVARAGTYRLAWMDRKGERTPLAIEPLAVGTATLSADGRRAAVNIVGNRGESLVAGLDLERGIQTSIGDPKARFYYGALISSDGQRVFTADAGGPGQTLLSFPFGGGAPTQLAKGEPKFEYGLGSLTPDGRSMLLTKSPQRDKVGDLIVLDLEGDHVPRSFMTTTEAEWYPSISPSGELVAYVVSNEEDLGGLLKLVSFPTPSAPVQVISSRVALSFGWLSASELYWADLSRKLWSATVASKGGQLDLGPPKVLFDGRPLDKGIVLLTYDLPRERFLVAIEESPREETQLILVSDWRPDAAPAQSARK